MYSQDVLNTILVDSVVHPFEQRESLLKLLKQHICNHIVKVGNKYYKQKIGIPQGSVVSTILCSLYYGHLEATELLTITNDPSSLLIRYVDDFLFITTELDRAKRLLVKLHNGVPKFQFAIQSNKTLVNFDIEIDGELIQKVDDLEMMKNGLPNGINILTSLSVVRSND